MAGDVRLTWTGRRPAQVPAAVSPPTRREAYAGAACAVADGNGAFCNRLICGDNLDIMAGLQAELEGKIALIYLDPPFFTGLEWQAQTPGNSGSAALSAYSDHWDNDLGAYLQWLYDRCALAHRLIAETGSLYLHLNWRAASYARLLLDEIFGPSRFQNEIAWCYREAINAKKRWNRKHDTLLFYSKSDTFTFNADAVRGAYAESNVKKYRLRDEKGAYRVMGRGITDSPLRSRRDLPSVYETEFPGLTYRHYLGAGTLPVDYWLIDIENQASSLRTGYPTQKPEALLERILLASSNPDDLVADFCCGSGTTLAVASRLARRWIGVDASPLAIHATRKRLLESGREGGKGGDGVPFVVESIGAAPETQPLESLVIVERAGGETRLRLRPEWSARADLWAVQWQGGPDTAFRPDWRTMRTRSAPTLAEVSAAWPAGAREADCRALVIEADGATRIFQAQASARREKH